MPREPATHGFWLYQSAGWSLFALLQLLVLTADQPLTLSTALPALLLWLLAFAGSLVLRTAWQTLGGATYGSAVLLAIWLLGPLLLAVLLDASHYWLLWPVSQLHPSLAGVFDAQPIGAATVLLWPLYLVWSALYLMLSRQQQLLSAKRARLDSELRLQQSQLESLLAQLNPHFMFNCINNIRALILENPAAARDMLAHFADMLRYQVTSTPEVLVPLREELAVANDYLALMHIQFEQRLVVTQQIDERCLAMPVPKLLLQLLLENAIKHGISRQARGGDITIEVQQTGPTNHWQLQVRNTGELAAQPCPSGSGLANLQQRLQLLFGDHATFTLTQQLATVCACVAFSAPPRLGVAQPTEAPDERADH